MFAYHVKTVVVTNNTSYAIYELYASASDNSTGTQANNLVAGQPIAPGQQTTVTIPSGDYSVDEGYRCQSDLMAVLYGSGAIRLPVPGQRLSWSDLDRRRWSVAPAFIAARPRDLQVAQGVRKDALPDPASEAAALTAGRRWIWPASPPVIAPDAESHREA